MLYDRRSQDLEGGGGNFFSKLVNLHVASAMRIARGGGGSGGCLRRNFVLNGAFWCIFESDFVIKFFKKYNFLYKNIYFRYTLAMGYFS